MQVVLNKTIELNARTLARGRTIEVSESRGSYLISQGLARPIEIKVQAIMPPPAAAPAASPSVAKRKGRK